MPAAESAISLVVTAGIGSIYSRTDGGANTSLYVKESGSGNTGWACRLCGRAAMMRQKPGLTTPS